MNFVLLSGKEGKRGLAKEKLTMLERGFHYTTTTRIQRRLLPLAVVMAHRLYALSVTLIYSFRLFLSLIHI